MRAVVVRRLGGPEVLEFTEIPVPRPGIGQVRVKVAAAGVNPVDAATRSGFLTEAGIIPPREVLGLGWDVAGTVDAVGDGVTGFAAGDAVIGLRDRPATTLGAYAGYVVLDADAIAAAPRTVSAVEAATLPLNALTALQALDLLDLPAGATVLVTGAAGAVGGYAVALAKARGFRVVAVAGSADEAPVRGFGAEIFVPRGDFLADRVRSEVPGGVDAALDTALLGLEALDAVANRGRFVVFAAGAAPIPLRGIKVAHVWIRADGAALGELATLADDGVLVPRIADTLPLDEAVKAHERLAAGGLRGRLALTNPIS
ncbi:NADP-dependent oxidoreductase [Amycolatopsis regifaucium]|uniref:NADPH:quinone reductase n=1 Tax=Amycolatopsis regifaucium TaxID=546365 RepID=A0A154MUY7_9PSEU|nr:NADP-dependent oxidoreductase [Amycolatopsis regifaucium]KZB88091.1 NADPH:quinone reductase [Amycolatopsis regifaucium]OKA04407.1 NADPH:quinone reductase [Amycolatopsis regifaucium]SFH48453.1 NADPH:quinone reductase [Amycolatopsis regifaucium]